MRFLKNILNYVTRLRERISISFLHVCPHPLQQKLMAVLAKLGHDTLWEQRRCPTCQKISHWSRDTPNEPFVLRKASFVSDFSLSADLSRYDIGLKLINSTNAEPTPDQITNAVLLMICTLKLLRRAPGIPFAKNVEQAIKTFDNPELRTSMVERLYHPEKYVPQPKS